MQIRTVKLKLYLPGRERQDTWKRLYQIANDAWRAANWIAGGQMLNDQLMRRTYARLKIDPTDMEQVGAAEQRFVDAFGTKRQATTERDVKAVFPDLPPCVSNVLNQLVVSCYKKEKKELLMGARSLRTYKSGMPFPIAKRAAIFEAVDDEFCFTWKVGRREKITFSIFFGRDRANNRLTIHRIINGDNDYGAPSIQLKNKKLFLLLPVMEPLRPHDLDKRRAVGVNLGIKIPAYAVVDDGRARMPIGDIEDFFRVRRAFQSRRRRIQRSLVLVRGGNGRKKKLKALEHLSEKERNFARQYNHMISNRIVAFAVKHRAATIKTELLDGYRSGHKPDILLRNWSYFELHNFIKYKAGRNGIALKFVDPYRISQTCSACGHYAAGQKINATVFKCVACGESMDANYNAALNNARNGKTVTKKEQCEYYAKYETPAGPTAER